MSSNAAYNPSLLVTNPRFASFARISATAGPQSPRRSSGMKADPRIRRQGRRDGGARPRESYGTRAVDLRYRERADRVSRARHRKASRSLNSIALGFAPTMVLTTCPPENTDSVGIDMIE